ncbi:MAG: hypothetical protein HQM10_09540 [Candidatus Riflebacteria bacterium]|nr:hypothetical protein [Candidatus Riflebacteria bacterium]
MYKKFILLVLAFSVISSVYGQSENLTAKDLERAVSMLWLEGEKSSAALVLEKIASSGNAEISCEAGFHLACLDLMNNNRISAQNRLEVIKKQAVGSRQKEKVESLKRLIFGGNTSSETINIDFQDTMISDILRQMASAAGKSIVVDSSIPRNCVTMSLQSVDFDEALKILSRVAKFDIRKSGDIYIVVPQEISGESISGDPKNISCDFQNIDLRTALKFIAEKAGINMVLHRNVGGTVSINLKDIDPGEALRLIAKSNDLYIEKEDKVFLVMKLSDMPLVTGRKDKTTFQPKFMELRDAMELVQREKINGVQIEERENNSIGLFGEPSAVEKARDLLEKMDKPHKPLNISTKIWEIGTGTVSIEDFKKMSESERLKVAKLIASPRIITLPGREASIEIKQDGPGRENGLGNVKIKLFPRLVNENAVQFDFDCKLLTHVNEDNRSKDRVRSFMSSLVATLDQPVFFSVQGGTILEVLTKNAD